LRVETVNAVALGDARFVFLSAEAGANVVGHTASLLLEVDEAQAVDADKFDREFRPMTATSNATTVMYGTAWDERTLLERAKQHNLELERRDGVRRHFSYDWQMVARYMPSYAAHVEHARATLGETHPTFLTQYCLKTIAGAGRWLSASQRAQLAGAHERRSQPAEGESYVAGLDIGGGEDPDALATARAGGREHDATVLTVGRLVYAAADALVREPRVEIVEHVCWQGEPHETTVWRVARVAVDATGLGETASRLIGQRLGASRVKAVKFSAQTKSDLGFELLAAINGGRLKMYRGDGSVEYREFWRQAELARVAYRANETMNFYVDPTEGHDDMLISAALAVHASRDSRRRIATGSVRS
jgi:hypothetical protein